MAQSQNYIRVTIRDLTSIPVSSTMYATIFISALSCKNRHTHTPALVFPPVIHKRYLYAVCVLLFQSAHTSASALPKTVSEWLSSLWLWTAAGLTSGGCCSVLGEVRGQGLFPALGLLCPGVSPRGGVAPAGMPWALTDSPTGCRRALRLCQPPPVGPVSWPGIYLVCFNLNEKWKHRRYYIGYM